MSFNYIPSYSTAPSGYGRAPVSAFSKSQSNDEQSSQNQSGPTKLRYILSPSLELVTAASYLLNIPNVHKTLDSALKRLPNSSQFRKHINSFRQPQISNRLYLATVFLRYMFNSSIGVHQEQAGMLLCNIIGLLFNIPLMIAMEIAVYKRGKAAGHHYAKVLALVNLMLTGLFTTGFVQKAKKDDKETYYVHDMSAVKQVSDPHSHLSLKQRFKLSMQEIKPLLKDSGKAYKKAAEEVQASFRTGKSTQAFLNPVNPDGTPGRVAFSAFTMPLGALIALLNVKSNPKLSAIAASISIIGNLENGLALSSSAWNDKKQPLRSFGVLGGLMSPVAEAVLTSKSALGPAAMSTSNAFQNLYQATAWTNPNASAPNGLKQDLTPKKHSQSLKLDRSEASKKTQH